VLNSTDDVSVAASIYKIRTILSFLWALSIRSYQEGYMLVALSLKAYFSFLSPKSQQDVYLPT
jgi:hypothetical protein